MRLFLVCNSLSFVALCTLFWVFLQEIVSLKCKDAIFSTRLEDGKDWTDRNLTYNWGKVEDYRLIRKIGEGSFGAAYSGILYSTREKVVMKIFTRKSATKRHVMKEVAMLHDVCGGPNIVRLVDVLPHKIKKSNGKRKKGKKKTELPILVFEYLEPQERRKEFSDFDTRFYMFEFLRAVKFLHEERGIIHRDLKPHNIVYHHGKKELKLIDLGISKYHLPGHSLSTYSGTRYYKPPEFHVDFKFYDTKLDIWSVGVIMAELVFKKAPFFRAGNDFKQLVKILQVLGTDKFLAFTTRYNITVHSNVTSLPHYEVKPWDRFITEKNYFRVSDDAIDLIDKMCRYDFNDRISASEAMWHPYFDPIRAKYGQNITL